MQTTNSTGFIKKKRSCLTQTAAMLFKVFSNNRVVKMFLPDGVRDSTVLKELGTAVPESVSSCILELDS